MVETLTDNNLTLEEEIRTLRENVADLVSFTTDVINYLHGRQYMFVTQLIRCYPSQACAQFLPLFGRSRDYNKQKVFCANGIYNHITLRENVTHKSSFSWNVTVILCTKVVPNWSSLQPIKVIHRDLCKAAS